MEPSQEVLGEKTSAAELLAQLTESGSKFPSFVLRAAMERLDELSPAFLTLLQRAADNESLSENEATAMFRGLHMLGTARDRRACKPLLALLCGEPSEVEYLLGDAVTETLPRIVAGVFDGDGEALFAAVIDPRIDEVTRYSLLMAATFLAWDGRIERARMIAFLERFDDEHLTPDYDATWDAWQNAIALLGLRTLAPRVERAWRHDRLPEMLAEKDEFAEMLARAEASPRDAARFEHEGLGYLDDIVEALSWTASDADADDLADADDPLLDEDEILRALAEEDGERGAEIGRADAPVTNPMRHVGRNDPCPCGSGKKAKRCCLAR